MTKKIVFGAAFVFAIVALLAPGASASCPNSTSVSTYNPVTGAFSYWHTTLTGPGTTLVAKIWQTPSGPDVTGGCNTRNSADGNQGILYFGITPGDIGLAVNLADACVGGTTATCPTSNLAVLATVNKGNKSEFLTTQAPLTDNTPTFDFSTFGNHPMVTVPRPRITGSSKVGSIVTANVTADPVAPGAYEGTAGLITGYNILSKLASSDPGRNASAYDAVPQLLASSNGGPGSGSVSVDCTGGNTTLSRRFVVTQIVTSGGPSPTVSEPVLVSCDSSLAEPPGGKYKIVPKKNVAPNSKRAGN
jgi:hypothetical protein